jgi:hypothetical protein
MTTADALVARGSVSTGYRLATAAGSFDRARRGEDFYIAFGDFLDDWYHAEPDQRRLMIADPIETFSDDPLRKQAALLVASIDWLCWIGKPRISPPAWLQDPIFVLPDPWFVVPGRSMQIWQLIESPAPFRMRRIFVDRNVVDRA